jgi:hypothetical protein
MEPDTEEKKKKKITAPKDLYPVNTLDSDIVLSEFINQQEKMISLLKEARKNNLEKAKISISIAKLIKLKPGDTFRF